jgi:hypothetical protein
MIRQDRALSRISGPKRDGGTGGRRKLHNDELHSLIREAGQVVRMGDKRINMLVGNSQKEIQLGRPKCRLKEMSSAGD